MAARPAHGDLVADARDHRHQRDACRDDERQLRGAIGHAPRRDKRIERRDGVHQNGDDHHHDQKRRAAAHVQARELPRIFRGERQPMLVAVDGLMLGAVIPKHALDIAHAPDQPNVEHEHGHAQKAVHDVPGQCMRIVLAHQQVRDERRRHDEQHHAHDQAQHHGKRHLLLAEHRIAVGFRRRSARGRSGSAISRGRLGNHLQRTLSAQGVDHGVGAAEIILPGERGICRRRRGHGSFAIRVASGQMRWRLHIGIADKRMRRSGAYARRVLRHRRFKDRLLLSVLAGPGSFRLPHRSCSLRSDSVGTGHLRPLHERRIGLVFLILAERMERGDLERLVSQHQRFHHGTTSANAWPIHPAVLRSAACQVMGFLVHAAIRLAHAHGPVVLAAHHHALEQRLAAHVRLARAILGKRAGKVALRFRHVTHA